MDFWGHLNVCIHTKTRRESKSKEMKEQNQTKDKTGETTGETQREEEHTKERNKETTRERKVVEMREECVWRLIEQLCVLYTYNWKDGRRSYDCAVCVLFVAHSSPSFFSQTQTTLPFELAFGV